ncbi:MAG TPA: DUF6350 family protein, partial [Actinoplanes sp.]|nr:DUF6350 family protein [Actinoplanes sp.]
MPTTSDGPPRDAGRSADPAAPAAPDQGQSSARETVPLDIGSRPSERETVLLDLDHPGAAELRNRETVQLPRQRGRPGGRTRRAPLIVAAAFATCWAALLSWLPVAVVLGVTRFAEGAGGVLAAAQAGLAAWLLGHGVPLGTSVGPVTLAPLLLTVLALWRLSRAGLHVTRAMGARGTGSPRAALTAGIAVGIGYGALGALA